MDVPDFIDAAFSGNGTAHYLSEGEETTRSLGRAFASRLGEGAVVALIGELGAGKTAFVRGVCAHFECEEQVSSPSFTIINEYAGTKEIVHADLYRIRNVEELLGIGFEEILYDGRIKLIEWAERAAPLLPMDRIEAHFDYGEGESERRISIQCFGAAGQ